MNIRDEMFKYMTKVPSNAVYIVREYERWRRSDVAPNEDSMIYSCTLMVMHKHMYNEMDIQVLMKMQVVNALYMDWMGTEALRVVMNRVKESLGQ